MLPPAQVSGRYFNSLVPKFKKIITKVEEVEGCRRLRIVASAFGENEQISYVVEIEGGIRAPNLKRSIFGSNFGSLSFLNHIEDSL